MAHPLAAFFTPSVRAGFDLTARQVGVLAEIFEAEPQARTVRALAETLEVAKPVITRAADRLEGNGLAIRVPDEKDRRSVFIQITKKGEKLLAELKKRFIEATHAVVS